jgi:phosphatidylethanolamine N-methyltransferase
MDQGLSTGAHQDTDGLRERNTRVDSTVGREALTAVGEGEIKDKDGKASKTFGRTPDGTGKLAVC